jgi:hypothetical protein
MISKIERVSSDDILSVSDLESDTLYEIIDTWHSGKIVVINYNKNCLIALNANTSWTWGQNIGMPPQFKFRKFTGKIELSNE